MNSIHEVESNTQTLESAQAPKGLNPFGDFSCCILKKCCKKYKKGSRCKKCPNR